MTEKNDGSHMRGRKRRSQLNIRLTPAEAEELRLRASEAGMTMTDYIVSSTLRPEGRGAVAAKRSVDDDYENLQRISERLSGIARSAARIEAQSREAVDPAARDALIETADRLRMFTFGCEMELGKAMDGIGAAYKSLNRTRH